MDWGKALFFLTFIVTLLMLWKFIEERVEIEKEKRGQ